MGNERQEEKPQTAGGDRQTSGEIEEGLDGDPGATDYEASYSEAGFRAKVGKFAAKAGLEVTRHALVLFYCAQDPGTPKWAKAQIAGALGYFIVPLDAIPDLAPVVGFADDLGVLVLALAAVAAHIQPEHRAAAAEKLAKWFGDAAASAG